MGKLVRDRIPESIEASGRRALTRVLDDAEYDAALLDKLLEEVDELRGARQEERLEEAADVYEVLLAIIGRLGLEADDLAVAAARKRKERGGFEARLWWESSSEAR